MTLRRVAKRDGREVPFDEGKIRSAVERAMAAVGEEDRALGAEVAALVRLTLEQRYAAGGERDARAVPHIEEIQDLVEQALIELGRAAVAKAYIVYRDRRAQVRDALRVHERPEFPRGRTEQVTVQDTERVSSWSKARIVAALMGEAELARETAEHVAARVEARVLELGQRRISTALIRELVDGELLELGLEGARRRQTSIGVPLFDLRRLVGEPPPPLDPLRPGAPGALAERSLEARVAGEVLRRHALSELLPEATVEHHLAGDLEVVGLESLQRPLCAALPAELLAQARAARPADAFGLLDPLAAALRRTGLGVVLEDAHEVLAALLGASAARARPGEEDDAAGAWLAALGATAHAAGRRVDLAGLEGAAPFGARRLTALARLLRALEAQPASAWLPRVFVDEGALEGLLERLVGDDHELAEALERLLGRGLLVPTWSAQGERFVGPGCRRGELERGAIACGAALALNLPRLALQAGPWREDRLFEGLADLVARGADALARVGELQARARAGEGSEPAAPRARPAYAFVPVGLREALCWLGDGEIRPEQGARLLGFLGDHLRRLSQRHRLAFVLSPFFGERARARFARLDREAPQHAQRLLFDEGVGAGVEPGAPYAEGFRLSPAPGFVPWSAEAELLRTVASGALFPLPEERARGAALPLREAWARFARLRREVRGSGPLVPAAPPPGELDLFASPSVEGAAEPFDGAPAPRDRAADPHRPLAARPDA